MSLEGIKLRLRIDYNFGNDLIEGLVQSVKSELLLSGVPDHDKDDSEYLPFCIVIKYTTARDYESRGYSNDQSRNKVLNEKGLQEMILKSKKW